MFAVRLVLLVAALALAGCVGSPYSSPDTVRVATTTGAVNLRAGPGTRYPRITVVPARVTVSVYGCEQGYSWCDVGYAGNRGWISSRFLNVFYDARRVYTPAPSYSVPVITFGVGYWDRWYRDYPWYRDYRVYYRYPAYRYPNYRPIYYPNRYPYYRYPRRNDPVFYPPR